MTTTSESTLSRLRYHRNAYKFVFAALRFTQEKLGREADCESDGEDAHISPVELLDGIRAFAREQFGLMAISVFRQWGIRETDDFGRIVFEMIEQGEMRKTDRDHLSDFSCVYEFQQAFDDEYTIDTSHAYSRKS